MSSNSRTSVGTHSTFLSAWKISRKYIAVLLVESILMFIGAIIIYNQPSESQTSTQSRIVSFGMIFFATVLLLVAFMVRNACHMNTKNEVAVNWHDLFKATHSGRIFSAVMTLLFSMRMRDSWISDRRGKESIVTVVLIAFVFVSITATALFTHFHSASRAAYMELGRLRRIAKQKVVF